MQIFIDFLSLFFLPKTFIALKNILSVPLHFELRFSLDFLKLKSLIFYPLASNDLYDLGHKVSLKKFFLTPVAQDRTHPRFFFLIENIPYGISFKIFPLVLTVRIPHSYGFVNCGS